MKIFDCFMYYDEDLILDLRLNLLNSYVDEFVIVESLYTHSGELRKLRFDVNKYSRFKNKIILFLMLLILLISKLGISSTSEIIIKSSGDADLSPFIIVFLCKFSLFTAFKMSFEFFFSKESSFLTCDKSTGDSSNIM